MSELSKYARHEKPDYEQILDDIEWIEDFLISDIQPNPFDPINIVKSAKSINKLENIEEVIVWLMIKEKVEKRRNEKPSE